MTVTGAQASRLYGDLVGRATALIDHYNKLKAELSAKRDAVIAFQEVTRAELAAIYLPRLDAATLESAERLTGFRGFSRRNPVKALENERRRLQALVDKIAASETYQRRSYLVGPAGEYTRALTEAQDLLDPWERECARFEELDSFLTLYELGYDTPRYDVRWLDPAYWRYWARGDAICEALQLDDFGDDVLPAYEKVRKPRDQWRGQVADAQKKVAAVHSIVQRHDQALARLQQLPAIYHSEAQQMLAGHLELADPSLLAQWAGEDRGIIMALRKLGGLQAKRDFLDDAIERGLGRFIGELETRRTKYRRKVAKYQRAKHASRRISERELDRGFAAKTDKYYARAEKLSLLSGRVLAYDQYDRFDLDNPPELWFSEFTGGKAPSRLTPTLRSWYDRNPGQTPRRDPSTQTGRLAAAAPASDRLDELGYLS
ncbi:MAG: hypothetical protein ACI8S6_003168 [Myxococcota bacterium]